MKNTIRFTAIFFAVITVSALMAHLLELSSKMDLSKQNYQIVQGIYQGWNWLGIFEIGTILLIILWLLFFQKSKEYRPYLLVALSCFVASTTLFFIFTLPVNKVTNNWTTLNEDWQSHRNTWEYSHAVRAILHLIGFCFLILKLLKREKDASK